jgi:hypothetical protein
MNGPPSIRPSPCIPSSKPGVREDVMHFDIDPADKSRSLKG